MDATNHISLIFATLFGSKDFDFSYFLTNKIRTELNLDRTSLDILCFNRLKSIIRHAQKTTKYYSKKFSEYGVNYNELKTFEDIKKFPVTTKDSIRKSLTDMFSGGYKKQSWSKSATGGTTSSPVTIYCNRKGLWHKNASSYAIDEWYGKMIGDRIVYLWGAPQDLPIKKSLEQILRNISYQHRLMLPSVPINDSILKSHCNKIIKWKPTFLQAYPTPLYELCLYMMKNKISFPFLKSASVTAEPLSPKQRELIESAFGFKLFNWYGSRELSRVASECEYHDGLHINEPSVYVEIEKNPDLPYDYGHLVITDLRNKATPLIRYKTDDIARWKVGSCKCGRALKRIASVEGRLTDLLILPNGKRFPGVSLTNRVIKSFKEISELQIVQRELTEFLLLYTRGPLFNNTSLEHLKKQLCTLLDENVDVTFKEVSKIPREKSGKVRFVINEMKKENNPS